MINVVNIQTWPGNLNGREGNNEGKHTLCTLYKTYQIIGPNWNTRTPFQKKATLNCLAICASLHLYLKRLGQNKGVY